MGPKIDQTAMRVIFGGQRLIERSVGLPWLLLSRLLGKNRTNRMQSKTTASRVYRRKDLFTIVVGLVAG